MTEPTWPERHGREVGPVLAGGEASSIKRLYVNLGSFMEEDYEADVEAVPLLSLPETGPVVSRLLKGVRGLLLDAGCGPNPGVAIALARQRDRTVVALDIGPGTVRLAVARARREGVELLGIVGDVEELPFRPGAFAGGVCDDTIEHLPDDDRGAFELARVLAADGRMVVATPNRHSLAIVRHKVADRLRGRRRPAAAYYVVESHLREYTWRSLGRVLGPHLRVRGRASVGWSGGWPHRLASVIVSLPGPRWFSRMVVVAVEPRAHLPSPS